MGRESVSYQAITPISIFNLTYVMLSFIKLSLSRGHGLCLCFICSPNWLATNVGSPATKWTSQPTAHVRKQTVSKSCLGRKQVFPEDYSFTLRQLVSLLSSILGAVLKDWYQGLNSHHAELSSAWDLFVVFLKQAERWKSALQDIVERSGSLPNSLDDSLFTTKSCCSHTLHAFDSLIFFGRRCR